MTPSHCSPLKRPSPAVVSSSSSSSAAAGATATAAVGSGEATSTTTSSNLTERLCMPESMPLSPSSLSDEAAAKDHPTNTMESASHHHAAAPPTTAFVASITRMLLVICAANFFAVACLVVLDATAEDTIDIHGPYSTSTSTKHRRGLTTTTTGTLRSQPAHSWLRLQSEWKPSVFTGEEFQAKRVKPKGICPDAERFFETPDLKERVDVITAFYQQNPSEQHQSKDKNTMFGPKGPTCTKLTKYKGGSICLPHTTTTTTASSSKEADDDKEECHIFRSGGGDNWNWEQQILSVLPRNQNCNAHKADCGIAGVPNKPDGRHDLHFYNHCLSDHFHMDEQGRYHVLYFDLLELAQLGHRARPLLLKLDAPADTTLVLPEMMQQDQKVLAMKLPSSLPQQLLVEADPHNLPWVKQMFTEGGYVPIHQRPSLKCPTCYQVLFFQVMC